MMDTVKTANVQIQLVRILAVATPASSDRNILALILTSVRLERIHVEHMQRAPILMVVSTVTATPATNEMRRI